MKIYLVLCRNREDKIQMLQQFFIALKMFGTDGWCVDKQSYTIRHDTGTSINFMTAEQLYGSKGMIFSDIYRSPEYNQSETFETKAIYDWQVSKMQQYKGKGDDFLFWLMRKKSGVSNAI